MRSTFQNAGTALSMALYFTILIHGMSASLPQALSSGMIGAGVQADVAAKIAALPPTSALFAAFLGFNPMGALISADTMASFSQATQQALLAPSFFPQTIAPAVMSSLRLTFIVSAVLSVIAAVVSAMRGKRYVNEE